MSLFDLNGQHCIAPYQQKLISLATPHPRSLSLSCHPSFVLEQDVLQCNCYLNGAIGEMQSAG